MTRAFFSPLLNHTRTTNFSLRKKGPSNKGGGEGRRGWPSIWQTSLHPPPPSGWRLATMLYEVINETSPSIPPSRTRRRESLAVSQRGANEDPLLSSRPVWRQANLIAAADGTDGGKGHIKRQRPRSGRPCQARFHSRRVSKWRVLRLVA